MAYPRSYTVNSDEPGFYHCVSRCVRRAWLCGDDPLTGRNYDHRRDLMERRLIDLSESFAISLYAWAVMSNHTHVVLRIDPQQVIRWSDTEVAFRWARLTRTLKPEPAGSVKVRMDHLLQQPDRLAEVRQRLGDLSWFMRFLNECVARHANAEDQCTGRFWEGRFKCQALLDESAVLACMAYVDLNPIRAGLADNLIDSEFTSIQRRLRELNAAQNESADSLRALAGDSGDHAPEISIADYIELVEWTALRADPDKRGIIDGSNPSALAAIRGSPDWWAGCVLRIESVFGTAVGTPSSLKSHASATGRRWLRGL